MVPAEVKVWRVEDFHGMDREAIILVLPLPRNKPADWKEERLRAKIPYVGETRGRSLLAIACSGSDWTKLKDRNHLYALLWADIREKSTRKETKSEQIQATDRAEEPMVMEESGSTTVEPKIDARSPQTTGRSDQEEEEQERDAELMEKDDAATKNENGKRPATELPKGTDHSPQKKGCPAPEGSGEEGEPKVGFVMADIMGEEEALQGRPKRATKLRGRNKRAGRQDRALQPSHVENAPTTPGTKTPAHAAAGQENRQPTHHV
jgi:hypothetical protein